MNTSIASLRPVWLLFPLSNDSHQAGEIEQKISTLVKLLRLWGVEIVGWRAVFFAFRDGHHQEFIDALAIHIDHFKAIALPLEMIRFPWDTLQDVHHKTRQGVIATFLVDTENIMIDKLRECVEI
jgi:hypothetical protein